MRRVLCAWLPTFSTDLLRRTLARRASGGPPERSGRRPGAIILTRPVALREQVVARCEVAAGAGVGVGMDLAHARPLVPAGVELRVEAHRADRDDAALHALACRALRFSPLAAPDPPDGLVIDITGTERVHRGEARLVRSVARELHRLGFAARVATASTVGCAWAVSRFASAALSRVAPGSERDAIGALPVAALRVDGATVRSLAEIGIVRVEHVLALPRASLAARFDAPLLRRVQQALGQVHEPVDPVRPAPPLRCERVFDGPTDRWESVEAAARGVLHELAAELARRDRGVQRLIVELRRPYAPATGLEIHLSRPSRAEAHLWSLVRQRLERVDLGEGVEGVALTAVRTARLRHEQRSSDALGGEDGGSAESAWGELVDTLAGRLGSDGVVRVHAVESHLPERAFRVQSAMEATPKGPPAAITHADRPTTLLARPEPAEALALTPDGPLLSLGWRGRRWTVVGCTGPERIGQEWWRWTPSRGRRRASSGRERPPDRDYFAVQTECGRRLWVFRHVETSRWFVHGEWS